ncbi:S8 family serine peptidase [Actinorhabdospora filicis]|uniref:S8 family serine peptidase n=1 Tax=Actinorhabdospora filicis TaxID=1785913 RepID=UPI00255498A7|nr:S8 family serine peptidase [Actinorhabdospora filicis]
MEFDPNLSYSPSNLDDKAAGRGLFVEEVRRFDTLFNGMAVAVDAARAGELAALPGVAHVYPVNTYSVPTPITGAVDTLPKPPHEVERDNVTVTGLTGVPEAHRDGVRGKGIKVGIIDSGVDYTHPALGNGPFPNKKVVGGYDVVDGDADPMDSPSGASGHGTHVAGIIAGSDGHMVGVAPEAKLYAYRVFGDARPTTDDVILEALERAVEDGVDVVNLSLGQAQSEVRQDALLPRALDAVAKRGVIPVVAIGNGAAGPFSPGSPGIAKNAITVGSVYATEATNLAFTVEGVPVPYNTFVTGPNSPAKGSVSIVDAGELCAPAAPGSLKGKLVLANSGWYPCTPTSAVTNAQAGGAAGVIWFDASEFADPEDLPLGMFWGDKSTIPAVAIRKRDGEAIRARLAAGKSVKAKWGSYWSQEVKGEFAGTPDQLSSWGPSHELDYKPDVVAPGGYVFSTVPRDQGFYAVKSGTSMATPHVVGAVALLLAERGDMGVPAMRDLLQSTAKPTKLGGDTSGALHQVAQQGAGLIDVPAALEASTKVSPAKLPLGELEGRAVTRTITLTNKEHRAVQYELGLESGMGAAPPYTSEYKTVKADAGVTLSAKKVTVPPRKSVTVTVTIRQPKGVVDGTVFGGWVTFTPKRGGEVLRASYMGVSGDWHKVSAINPTFTDINSTLDNPALRPEYFSFGKNEALTVTEAGKSAWLMLSHGFPTLRELRMEAVDSTGRVIAVPVREEWVVRNSGAGTGLDFLEWNLTAADGTPVANGTYRLRLVFDKILATGAPETWTSPEITVRR